MATTIRLSRFGTKGKPSYRIGIYEKRSKRDGRVIEYIGFYNPAAGAKGINYNKERWAYWISVGAKLSPSMASLLKEING